MPHLRHSEPELLRFNPKMEAPDEVLAEDLNNDEKDGIYQEGLRIARSIQIASELYGRLRHERAAQAGAISVAPAPPKGTSEASGSVVGDVFGVQGRRSTSNGTSVEVARRGGMLGPASAGASDAQ